MRHVPGTAIKERSLEEQADKLIAKLSGHSVFARMRGNVQGFPLWEFLDLDSDSTPSKSLREFDAYMADLRVMRNQVVWLRYHGYRRAAEELQHALSGPEYRMWCEDVPLDQSRVATVVMFDPEATMRIFRWWPEEGMWHLPVSRGKIPEATANMVASYPTLGQEWPRDAQPFLALRRDVINPLLAAAQPIAREVFERLSWSGPHYFPLYTSAGCRKPNERSSYEDGAWAYLFAGHEQGEVLSWFPRELQSKLATWQLRIPLHHLQGVAMSKTVIGFYPETEHPIWQKLCASRASRGVSAGMGIVVEPHEDCESDGRFILRSYTWR